MEKGKIIFLNGVSSTGKTTLSRTLQQRLDEPYHWLNVDEFIAFTDMRQHPAAYFEAKKDPVSLFPHVVKLYSDLGINVIADVAFMKGPGANMFLAEETMASCVEMLHEYPIMYVYVTCTIEELRRRHLERGDRGGEIPKEKIEQFLNEEKERVYDLRVDTFKDTKEECVDKIIAYLKNENECSAFRTLWSLSSR